MIHRALTLLPSSRLVAFALIVVFTLPIDAGAAPIFFEASGDDAAAIQASVDAFRTALGNPNNGNVAGPLPGGRREINWDGGGVTTTRPAQTPGCVPGQPIRTDSRRRAIFAAG